MTRYRFTMVVAASAVMALLATSCATEQRATPATDGAGPTRVERVRMVGGDWGFPTPYGGNSRGESVAVTTLLYDSLLWKDANGTTIPWLATAWEVSADGREWRFTLRDGVRWHDGTPLTAEDVAFSHEYATTGPGKNASTFSGRIPVEAVVEGPNRVMLRTETPYAPFIDRVGIGIPIVPKHVWADVADPVKYQDPLALTGSGPYRLETYDLSAGTYLFTSNEDYFMGPPYVKRLEFVPASNELLALQRGELDVASHGVGGGKIDFPIAQASLDALDKTRYGQVTAPGVSGAILHFNITKGFPYNDTRFRQAIAYAVDREDLVKRILLGGGEVGMMGMLEPSNSPWIDPSMPSYERDVAKAKALLDQAGVKDANGDGIRDLPDGQPFVPEVLTSPGWNPKTPELLKEYLREVGIDIKITSLDQTGAQTAAAGARYEMAVLGYGLWSDPDGFRTTLSSKSTSKSFAKVHGYVNARFDELAAQQLSQIDVAQRTRTAQEMQRIVAEDVPAIPLYVATRTIIFDKTVLDNWYYSTGAGPIYPGMLNKLIFVSDKRTGF